MSTDVGLVTVTNNSGKVQNALQIGRFDIKYTH
jgi:hypothetical protein